MTTAIPPTEFNRITRTKSSPEIIAALLNEAEATHSSTRRHANSKRVYPFWKTCKVCSTPYQCQTREQAARNKTCSPGCAAKAIEGQRARKPVVERSGLKMVACAVCGKVLWRFRSRLARTKKPTCSRQCNGKLRGAALTPHASKGRANWTAASVAYTKKMTGANNPAWKGGVTYVKRKGNYVGHKYVRCPAEFLPMARRDGYVAEHRLIVARIIGRLLTRLETVHHENHNPLDNRPENLMLFASNSDHKLYEAHGTPEPIWRW